MLVGILIFGEISEAIECPASGGGGGGGETIGTFASNVGTLGSSADAQYFEENISTIFQNVTGILNEAVYQEGVSLLEDQGEIRFGTPSQWNFLHDSSSGSNLVSINLWVNGDVVGGPSYPIVDTRHCTDSYDPTCVPYGGVEGDNDNGVILYTQSGNMYYRVFETGTDRLGTSGVPSPPDDSNWHMITVTYDKTIMTNTWTVCVDASCTSGDGQSFTGTTVNAVSTFTVGSRHGCCGGVVENGYNVDDVTVWDGYRLTQTNIDDLWNSGTGSSAGESGEDISPSSQVLHVTFDSSTFDVTPSTEEQVGAEQCGNAKDTAWTVIGIMPIALFFGLFALFSSFGKPQ